MVPMVLLLRWLSVGHRRSGSLLLAGAVVLVVGGGATFAALEHLPVTTGWYWAVTTATTVGYGDITPHNASGRVVASLLMLTAIPMVAAAFALFTGTAITEGLRRLVGVEESRDSSGFRLVVGAHPATMAILEELRRAGEDVVLVADVDPGTVPPGVRVVRGDPTAKSVLASAHPERAAHGLIGGTSDGDVLVSAVLLREQAPSLRLTALVGSPSVAEALGELGVAEVVSADSLVAHTIAKTLEAPHAGSLLLGLLASERERLVEEEVPPAATPRLLSTLRAARAELLLGVVHGGEVSLGVGDDPEVLPGDILLLVQASAAVARGRAGARRPTARDPLGPTEESELEPPAVG